MSQKQKESSRNDKRVIRMMQAKSAPIQGTAALDGAQSGSGECSIWCLGFCSCNVFTAATRTTEAETQTVQNEAHVVVAQLVEHHLAKVDVASSNLVDHSHYIVQYSRWGGREARQRTANPCTRVRIPFPPPWLIQSMLLYSTAGCLGRLAQR